MLNRFCTFFAIVGMIISQVSFSMDVVPSDAEDSNRKGYFITFEGGEGAGKTTQIQLLVDHLRLKGVDVVQTREPGGTEGASEIRNLIVTGDVKRWEPLSEVFLLMAARVDHWYKVIKPALEAGKWVVCDRFMDSTIAYQGYGHGVNISFLEDLYKKSLPHSVPNRTYVFTIDPKKGLDRSFTRLNEELRFEKMELSFHERLHFGFLEIARKNSNRCLVLDANGEIKTIHKNIVYDLEGG